MLPLVPEMAAAAVSTTLTVWIPALISTVWPVKLWIPPSLAAKL